MKTRLNIIDGGAVGCSRAVYARGLYPEVIYLNSPVTSVEFVSPQPGTYKVTCSMGMVTPITVNVL